VRYQLITALSGEFSVEQLCAALQVSRTAYYRYRRGSSYQLSAAKEANKQSVKRVFGEHKRRYGTRRIVAQLRREGHYIGRDQVRTLMKLANLQAIQPKSFVPRTTDSAHGKGYWPNLLLGQPLPLAPDRVWVSDITYLPLVNGEWAYLGSWMDLFSRRIVGWRVDETMEESLIMVPLQRALQGRQPAKGLITHSDRGGQYRCQAMDELVELWHIRPSMSRAGHPRLIMLMTMRLPSRFGAV
jgi:putative transposase